MERLMRETIARSKARIARTHTVILEAAATVAEAKDSMTVERQEQEIAAGNEEREASAEKESLHSGGPA